ncbi:antigen WC1.1-like [Lepisosteus oculatus]|uniref:antigen WC1.1-like n=1 Tax=Lepisosteus oculatus TaxID=7918 RepID=UPI0035F512B2
MKDAEVICRQLDCRYPAQLLRGAHFGEEQGLIRIEEIQCRGNETRIHDCPTLTREHQSCTHSNDIGLVCTGYTGFRLANGSDFCSGRVELQYDNHTLLRLSAGCSGQAEVYYNGTWGSICANSMTETTATVICKQLGCGDKGTIRETNSRLSPDPKWLDFFSCHKHDSTLWQCPSSPWGQNDCTDREEANITCSGSADVRLVNGASPCEGTVEVYHGGEWGTVRHSGWDLNDAAVVCRQLGCGSAVSAQKSAHFGPGSGSVLLSWVECSGSESALMDCGKDEVKQKGYSHIWDSGVICSGFVRLVNGHSLCSGRVEVNLKNTWTSVCDSDFDWQDAEVVCRELDCGAPAVIHRGAHFRQGQGAVSARCGNC